MLKFNRLRGLGPIGNAAATLLTFLTMNWAVALSAGAALAAAAIGWLREFVTSPSTLAGIAVFLAVLWTIIGITVLVDRRKPRVIRTHTDYRYGLTFGGLQPRYTGAAEKIPDAGSLHFSISLQNFSPSPIRYEYEHIDVRIGTRAIPRIMRGGLIGFMARGAGRTSSIRGFVQSELKEFYDAGPVHGTAEFSITYGPPEGPPERRLKMTVDMTLLFLDDGNSIGWQDNIATDTDEPFTAG